jgi:hypothetical protein
MVGAPVRVHDLTGDDLVGQRRVWRLRPGRQRCRFGGRRSDRPVDEREARRPPSCCVELRCPTDVQDQARYRLGGRAYPIRHAGSFRTLKEATKARCDLVPGEIAAGRNPADTLASILTVAAHATTLSTWGERFLASRIDVDENTKKNYRSSIHIIGKTFGDRDPATITATEVAEWIATLAEKRKPGTLGQYRIAFRLLLDHVGLDPNPARDPRVKLPKQVREEPTPPPAEHVLTIFEALGAKLEAPGRDHRAGRAATGGGREPALGRRRRGWPASTASSVRDQTRPCALGVPA